MARLFVYDHDFVVHYYIFNVLFKRIIGFEKLIMECMRSLTLKSWKSFSLIKPLLLVRAFDFRFLQFQPISGVQKVFVFIFCWKCFNFVNQFHLIGFLIDVVKYSSASTLHFCYCPAYKVFCLLQEFFLLWLKNHQAFIFGQSSKTLRRRKPPSLVSPSLIFFLASASTPLSRDLCWVPMQTPGLSKSNSVISLGSRPEMINGVLASSIKTESTSSTMA